MSSAQVVGSDLLLCLMLILLVPLALAGMALINTGFGRARSAAHAILASTAAISTAAVVYCAVGFSLEGFAGHSGHALTLGGVAWDWLDSQPFLLHGLTWYGPTALLALLLQVFAIGFAVLIPVSAGADRWRLTACCFSTALFAAITYPIFAHWVWGGGWLAQLGKNYGLGAGFLDVGGAGTLHTAGGLTALAITWILGPRPRRGSSDGIDAAIPSHNIVYVLFGCILMVPGWIGLNGAGALLFAGALPKDIAVIAVNTMLTASASLLAAMAVTRSRFGKPDASLSANGWVGGLVASSAVCLFVTPGIAILVGVITGVLVTFSVEVLEMRLSVDDPAGAVSVHAVAGIWGLLAVGIFARIAGGRLVPQDGRTAAGGQMLAQVIGIATLLGFVMPLTFGLNLLLDKISPYRVEMEGERLGMDLHELGAGAYPEFPMYNDEFSRRRGL